MALPAPVQAQVDNFNLQIGLLVAERDRLVQLLDQTLPGNTSVWNLIATNEKSTIKSDIQSNMTSAQSALTSIINAIGGL